MKLAILLLGLLIVGCSGTEPEQDAQVVGKDNNIIFTSPNEESTGQPEPDLYEETRINQTRDKEGLEEFCNNCPHDTALKNQICEQACGTEE